MQAEDPLLSVRRGHRVSVKGVIAWVLVANAGWSTPQRHGRAAYRLSLVQLEDGTERYVRSSWVVRAPLRIPASV